MKNDQPLKLSKLIFSSLIGSIFGGLNAKQKVNFPNQIGEYKFRKQIRIAKRNSKANKMFSYALYQNSKGQKAFAKMWRGKLKDLNYYTLRNETILYTVLNGAIRRMGKSMPKKFKNIHAPQIIEMQERKKSLILLVEFVEGIPASKLNTKKQFETYLKTVDFLNLLGSKLSVKEKEQIVKRDARTIILLYFPLLLKSILTHPKAIFSLIYGMRVFLQSVPAFLRQNQITLSHRDLHLENIVISKNKITLIDLQFCLFSNPLYDMLTTLRLHWSDRDFRQKLFDEIRNRSGKNKDFDTLVRGLMVHSATHSLAWNNFTKLITKKFIDYLNFALQPKLTF